MNVCILVKTKYAPHYELAVPYNGHTVSISGNELFAKILSTHIKIC